MLRKVKLLSLPILGALLLQGCLMSTKTYTPEAFQMSKTKKDKALVYFYRPDSIFSKHNPWQFVINNNQIVRPLLNNGYIPAYVKEGNTKVIMKQDNYPNNTYDELTLNLKAGKEYYIKAVPAAFDFSTMQAISKEMGSQEIRSSQYFKANQ